MLTNLISTSGWIIRACPSSEVNFLRTVWGTSHNLSASSLYKVLLGSALRSRSDSFGRRQRIVKPSLTQAIQNKRGATLARYQGHVERGLQMNIRTMRNQLRV